MLRLALAAHCLIFLLLILTFQFFWLDGKPYFVLGDDAMISMRYAWHWAHGSGIYWNTTPTPEGYTNFLLVAVMAALHQLAAILGVQMNLIGGMVLAFNLVVALASIYLMHLFVRELTGSRIAALVSACVLAINAQFLYWGKSGYETTLLVFFTICAGLLILRSRFWRASLLLTGAVLTRDDAALLVAVFAFAQLAGNRRGAWNRFLSVSLVPAIAFALHTLFRIWYYGDPLPNTYYLKATQLPLYFRFSQGAAYIYGVLPAFAISAWILVSRLRSDAGTTVDSQRRIYIALLALLPTYLLYILWVGGDAFAGSRLFASVWAVPCVAIGLYSAGTLKSIAQMALTVIFCLIITISPLNRETAAMYRGESSSLLSVIRNRHSATYVGPKFSEVPHMPPNADNTWQCLDVRNDARRRGLSHVSIAVYYAGTAPYFCPEFEAIDLLGKSDATIAKEAPHIPGRAGHNKYDYEFSLSQFRPTYILSLIPSVQAVNDIEYLSQSGEFNWNLLVQDPEFRLHYLDHPLPNTGPVIFIRDDAH